MAPNTSRGQTLIERPKRSRQIGTYVLAPPMEFALDFALGQYDVMRQIGKDVEYRRNWGAVLKSINKIGEGRREFWHEVELQDIMMEAYDYDVDYSVADSAADLYMDDPETFFEAVETWAVSDTAKQDLRENLEFAAERYENLDRIEYAIRHGYIGEL